MPYDIEDIAIPESNALSEPEGRGEGLHVDDGIVVRDAVPNVRLLVKKRPAPVQVVG